MAKPKVCVLGAFVANLTCQTARMSKWGETILGLAFKLGPGGKRIKSGGRVGSSE
jgi:hypothetical protein